MTAWSAVAAGDLERELMGVGIGAAAVLVVAIAGRWHGLVPWGTALVAVPYAISLLVREGGVDPLAPVYAAGLLLTAELGYWALELTPAAGGARIIIARVGALLGLAVAAGLAATIVLAVSEAGAGGGVALEIVGVAAAAAALGLVATIAWRSRPNNF